MRMPLKFLLLFIFPFTFLLVAFNPPGAVGIAPEIPKEKSEEKWVDSVFQSLSPEERIAQLFMIRTYSNRNRDFYDSISRIIIDYNIGGMTFFQGSPTKQAELINYWQHLAKTPLLFSIDAEWGLAMRLDSVNPFPKNITLGAVQDDELVYMTGYQIGLQCKRAGIQMNFAPVVDINSNPKNPVINFRSFGEEKHRVAAKGAAFIHGMQDAGVIATAKHFPGHGDTDSDSHYTLPLLNHTKAQIDSTDLVPFRAAIASNAGAIMVAHLFIPDLDSTRDRATSLSPIAVNQLLKNELGFQGLVVTDALDMEGVTSYHQPGDIELMALLAGNDILLLPLNIPLALEKIKDALNSGLITEEEINHRCRKVLRYKYKAGLSESLMVNPENLLHDLNCAGNEVVVRQVFEKAVTVLKNSQNILPLTHLDTLTIASLVIGHEKPGTFQKRLSSYAPVDHYNIKPAPDKNAIEEVIKKLEKYDLLIVGIENTSSYMSRKYGITPAAMDLIGRLKKLNSRIILDIFGNPYSLAYFDDHQDIDALVMSYEDREVAKDISAQIIFGAIGAEGRLPVTVSPAFAVGTGISTHATGRLKYIIPEEIGIPSAALDTINSFVEEGIRQGAYPGCQVLFALNGQVFYQKSFGYHTYSHSRPVTNDAIYDLASLTKILATTPSVMYLTDKGEFDIDRPLSEYLPELKGTDKQSVTSRRILAHQAMLMPWIPFYDKTLVNYHPDTLVYSGSLRKPFTVPVAKGLFIDENYRTVIFDSIISSTLLQKKEYRYSDLGFYLIYDAIEKLKGKKFADFTQSIFYKPLGLHTLGFNPLERFSADRIPPTEMDTVFRKQLIHGYVHDPGAAMLGGVCGHAGLFGTASDVAVMMQMFLQKGYYGGQRFFDPRLMDEFSRQQFPEDENRRALGFDKPYPEYDSLGPVCESASLESFGHSGFTGTYTWADPQNGLLYVFLSNRIYPDANNNKISELNVRTKVHQMMYDILNEKRLSAFNERLKNSNNQSK